MYLVIGFCCKFTYTTTLKPKKVKRANWHKNQNNSVDWLKISKSVVAICNETKITHTEANREEALVDTSCHVFHFNNEASSST